MKKLLACLAVSLTAISAQAQTATVELSSVEGLNGRPGATGYLVKWTTPMVKNVDWDFQLLSSQSDTNSVTTRAEIGLVPRYDLGWARFSTKVAVGKRMNSTGESNYYSMEPALTVPLNQSFSVRAGYRFREAFESSVADTTKTARLGLNYHLSKRDTVTVRYDRQRGDSDQNSWNLAYTRRF